MKHQIVTSKFPTLERQALNRVREQFPRLKRRGFATALRAAFPHEIHRKEVSFIPDGWFIEGDLLAGENGGPTILADIGDNLGRYMIEHCHSGRFELRHQGQPIGMFSTADEAKTPPSWSAITPIRS
jgi:hypothetical protein